MPHSEILAYSTVWDPRTVANVALSAEQRTRTGHSDFKISNQMQNICSYQRILDNCWFGGF